MKTILAVFAATGLLFGQATNFPRLSGSNPSVDLGSTVYNVGTVRVYTGSGVPSSPTPLVVGVLPARGDLYLDTTNTILYYCTAATCSTSGSWRAVSYPTVIPVTVFGVNGTTADASNLTTAFTAASGNFCLYVPHGLTINMANNSVSVPANTCIYGDGPTASKVQGSGLAVAGVGIWDVIANANNVTISGIGFDGGVTSAAGATYTTATGGGPQQALFTTGSTIWLHGPLSNFTFSNGLIQHTGGYAIYGDASTGNISKVLIRNNTFQNNRPFLFGSTSGNENYGSWVGGVLFQTPGSSYIFSDVVVDGNTAQNVTGNAFWSHNGTVSTSLLNQRFAVTNNICIDTGLDCLQFNAVDGYKETGNISYRNGYVITSDVGASRVGGPLWLQNYPPSAFDGGIGTFNATRSNNVADTFNGGAFDLDGSGHVTLSGNTMTSCFLSDDPLNNMASCGPSSAVGTNYTYGIAINNSQGIGAAGQSMAITGNSIIGVGQYAISAFGMQQSVISGNFIQEVAGTANANPITLGNLVGQHANWNFVTSNNILWSPTSGAASVFEDGVTYQAFSATDQNIVRGNYISPYNTLAYEFQKATPDVSGTGPLFLSSVTAGAASITGIDMQAAGSSGNPYLSLYLNNGAGTLIGQFTGGGFQPLSVAFSSLPAAASYTGAVVYCNNCAPASSPCTGSSTGALAVSNGSSWACK